MQLKTKINKTNIHSETKKKTEIFKSNKIIMGKLTTGFIILSQVDVIVPLIVKLNGPHCPNFFSTLFTAKVVNVFTIPNTS